MVHSLSDPICVAPSIPFQKIKDNPNLLMVLAPNGGHIEFCTGPSGKYWSYSAGVEFLLFQARKNGHME
jgi:predicted alpha/beta-fold hydrolase